MSTTDTFASIKTYHFTSDQIPLYLKKLYTQQLSGETDILEKRMFLDFNVQKKINKQLVTLIL